MNEVRPEIGIECTCGFKRRATKVADGGKMWNGREIEAFHTVEHTLANRVRVEAGQPLAAPHTMTMGLIATMDWLPLSDAEHRIGEAWRLGFAFGDRTARDSMKARITRAIEDGS